MGSTPKVKKDPAERELERIGAEEWERYKQDFAPEEKKFVGDVSHVGSQTEQQYISGIGSAEMQQQAGQMQATDRPGGIAQQMVAMGKAQGQLDTTQALASRERKTRGLETAIGLGRGIGAESLQDLGRQAQLGAAQQAARAEARADEVAGRYKAAATVGGGIVGYMQDRQSPKQDDINASRDGQYRGHV